MTMKEITTTQLSPRQSQILEAWAKRSQISEQEIKIYLPLLEENPDWIERVIGRGIPFDAVRAISTLDDWPRVVASPKFSFKSVEAALSEEDCPSLATLKLYQGDVPALLTVAHAVAWLMAMVEVQRKPTDVKVQMIAKLVMGEYYFLKLSEIRYAFERALLGDYGELYGKIDATDVARFLRMYCEQRGAVAASLAEERHRAEMRAAEQGQISAPDALDKIRAVITRLEEKNAAKAKKAGNKADLEARAARITVQLEQMERFISETRSEKERVRLQVIQKRAERTLEDLRQKIEELSSFETH